jgi:iron(III) transport system permease protein
VKKKFSILHIFSILVAVIVAIPVMITIYSAVTGDPELWSKLYKTRLKLLLPNTIKLLISVGFLTFIFGVFSSWVVSRFDFWGKKVWEWALILPLAMPGYVLAYSYASIMAPGGVFKSAWISIFGDLASAPSLYSFWGVSIVLSLVNYPYVYLLSRSAFLNQNDTYDEAAQVLGVSKWKRFWSVQVRMAYPGIVAGLALTLMEVLSDFGTVAILRYPTFTEAIYRQMTARFDSTGAAALSVVLVTMTLMMLVVERYFRGKRTFEQTRGKFMKKKQVKLSRVGTVSVTIAFLFLLGFAFLAPVSLLINWSYKAISNGGLDKRMIGYALNTLYVSVIGATVTMLLALPVAYLSARYRTFFSKGIYYISTLGYSLPGPVLAVGILLTVSMTSTWFYGSILLLFTAYAVRFIPVAIQSQESSISMVSQSMEDAAKTLGAGRVKRVTRVLLPLIKPGLLTGWAVVFVDCMKELPATMMLRPTAFDTLAMRVWIEATEALWEMAAIPALLIVLAGLVPLSIIIRKSRGDKNGIQPT